MTFQEDLRENQIKEAEFKYKLERLIKEELNKIKFSKPKSFEIKVKNHSVNHIIRILLPDTGREELELLVENNSLILVYTPKKDKSNYYDFSPIESIRQVILSSTKNYDVTNIESTLSNGVLEIKLPKILTSKEEWFKIDIK